MKEPPSSAVDSRTPNSTALERGAAPPGKDVRNRKIRSRRRWVWLTALLLLCAALYLIWPKKNATKSGGAAPTTGGRKGGGPLVTPVVAARARTGDLGVYFNGLGSVTPIYLVMVRSRVDGQLMRVLYKEGDIVHQGDLLVEIDPRPYQVQLEQAEGQLAKDQANLANARTDLARYETLLTQNAIPEQQVATQRAVVTQDQGTIKSDQASIDSAKLNIAYCHITAPITGRVGLRLVDPGNIVHASDQNGLLVITQMQPIAVIFTLPEDDLQAVNGRTRSGATLQVKALSRDDGTEIASGTFLTIDNKNAQTT